MEIDKIIQISSERIQTDSDEPTIKLYGLSESGTLYHYDPVKNEWAYICISPADTEKGSPPL